jgi:hypothetical protein
MVALHSAAGGHPSPSGCTPWHNSRGYHARQLFEQSDHLSRTAALSASCLHHPYTNFVTDSLQTPGGLADIHGAEGRHPVFIGLALQYHRLRHRPGQLSDQLCHLCGAESIPATFARHTDADSDPYTHIHAYGHSDLRTYLDADFHGYADGHCNAQLHSYAHHHADCNGDLDDGPTDGYRYPIALGYPHCHADSYIHRLLYAHADTTAPHGDALGYCRTLAVPTGFAKW